MLKYWLLVLAIVAQESFSCVIVHDRAAGQDVRLDPSTPNAVRVRVVPQGASFRDDLVSALVNTSGASTALCSEVELSDGQPASITNGNLHVAIGSDGKITATRVSDGKVLLKEKSVRTFTPAEKLPVAGFSSLDLTFEAVQGERIYGLGQHAKLSWDKTGSSQGQLDNKNVSGLLLSPHDGEILIPVVHSSLEYAFLFNLPALGNVEYNESMSYWHADAVLQLDMWLATTADSPPHTISPWQQLQRSYVDATGHSPVYPDWTTGFWQCKLRYSNQTQIMDVVQGYTERQIPISLIIIDFYSWNDPSAPKGQQNTLGDETLPASCWPDPKGMVDKLREMGVELMISPYSHSVASTSKNYDGALASGLLAKDGKGQPALGYAGGYVYDLFNPAARDYAFDAMQRGYMDMYGLHHWWLDCNEPCGGTNNGSFANDWTYNNGTWPAAFVGAAYPHMVNQMIYEGMAGPGKAYQHDNVMLARSAWAGSQRLGAAVWSGDTSSTWDDFNQQFRAGLNMAMSGIPYWTTDIGGFSHGDTTSSDFRELVVRWFQWGAFCPLFRLHGTRKGPKWPAGPDGLCGSTASNEVWSFGNESEAAIVRVMRMREQLRPYVMEQYEETARSGAPIIRPMFYDFWTDTKAHMVDDQQMFGPDYLVAPVLKKGAKSRYVYLPQLPSSHVWVNVFTGIQTNTTAGPLNISEATPLDTFPLYRRSKVTPQPPPPPPPPVCDNSCKLYANTDVIRPGHVTPINNSVSFADCCAKCKATDSCDHFVRGPFNSTDGSGPMTCFLLSGSQGYKHRQPFRNLGCVGN